MTKERARLGQDALLEINERLTRLKYLLSAKVNV